MVSRATIGLTIGCLGLIPLACVALGVRVAYRPAQGSSPFGSLTATAVESVAAQEQSGTPMKLPQVLRLAPRPAEAIAVSASKPAPVPENAPAPVQTMASSVNIAPPTPDDREAQQLGQAAVPPASQPDEQAEDVSTAAAPAGLATVPGEADEVSEAPQTTAVPAKGSININKASVETLNHLPGAGLIGRTIVSHRPYRSVQDLVDRKILRFSAFQKVKSRIRVD